MIKLFIYDEVFIFFKQAIFTRYVYVMIFMLINV